VKSGIINSTRFFVNPDTGNNEIAKGVCARLKRFYTIRIQESGNQQAFDAVVRESLSSLSGDVLSETIRRADAIADHASWDIWTHFSRCTLGKLVETMGLPGEFRAEGTESTSI